MMKPSFVILACNLVLLITACAPGTATPTPVDVSGMQTQAVATAYAMLTRNAPTLTPTATVTPTPAITNTPTPSYSAITFNRLYLNGTYQTVVIFDLNGVLGDFTLKGNDYIYTCAPGQDNPDELWCRGVYQPEGLAVYYQLFVSGQAEPIVTQDMVIPVRYPPTPEGMVCEIEPLWVPPLTGNNGCYAVTCYVGAVRYGGTTDTCIDPWTWPLFP